MKLLPIPHTKVYSVTSFKTIQNNFLFFYSTSSIFIFNIELQVFSHTVVSTLSMISHVYQLSSPPSSSEDFNFLIVTEEYLVVFSLSVDENDTGSDYTFTLNQLTK